MLRRVLLRALLAATLAAGAVAPALAAPGPAAPPRTAPVVHEVGWRVETRRPGARTWTVAGTYRKAELAHAAYSRARSFGLDVRVTRFESITELAPGKAPPVGDRVV